MDDSSRLITTRTGYRFSVRPVSPADESGLADLFAHVSRDDLRFRFLSGLKVVGHDRIVALAEVDHEATENFLAFDAESNVMIASGMLACDPALERGEVAIAIHEDFKQRGVGWELLEHIARFAEAKGVKVLESVESCENHAAIELEREMGFTAVSYPGDASLMLVSRKLGLAAA